MSARRMEVHHASRGFTLIELLVVIAIIGMLSSVVLASLNSARVKSRDARRVQDLNTIRTAVELYYSDYGHYPIANTSGVVGDAATIYWTGLESQYAVNPIVNPSAATLTAALSPYLKGTVVDPKGLGADSGYLYLSHGADYCIMFWRTPENLNNFKSYLIPPSRCTGWNASGQCTAGPVPVNSIYFGTGPWANGC